MVKNVGQTYLVAGWVQKQPVYKSTNVRLNNMCNVCRCCLSTTKMCTVQTISMICSYLQTNNGYILYTICIPPMMLAIWQHKIITFSEVQYEMYYYCYVDTCIHLSLQSYKIFSYCCMPPRSQAGFSSITSPLTSPAAFPLHCGSAVGSLGSTSV